VRKEIPGFLLLNAGNLLFRREQIKPEKVVESRLIADLIISSYNTMGCDVLNIGAYDLSLGIDYLMKKQSKAKYPFISANLCDKHGKLIFKPWVMKSKQGVKIAVLGLIDKKLKLDRVPGGHKIMVKDPLETAGKLVPQLKKSGADYVILLTNMAGLQCRRLAQHGLPIDLIIGSSRKNQISLPIEVKNTYITHLDRGGKNIGQLMITFLSAAGVEALSPSERMKGKEINGKFYLNKFVQLRLDIPDHPDIGPKVNAVLEKLKRLQKVKATGVMSIPVQKKVAGIREGNRYVGVEVCRRCHQERYERWKGSGHSRAYQSLVVKKQQFDVDCIGCHSLAYDRDGGFTDLKNISFFANVQCESCHGPGGLHVQAEGDPEKIVKKRDPEICLQCHIPEKSPDFVFMDYFIRMCKGKENPSSAGQ